MNEDISPDSQLTMSRAVRFALAAIVVGMSYPNIHCAFGIEKFRQIYADMLGNKSLPAATVFVVRYRSLFAGRSILLPVGAVARIFAPTVSRSIYVSGILVICTFFQLFFQWHALTAPIFTIIQGMQAQ